MNTAIAIILGLSVLVGVFMRSIVGALNIQKKQELLSHMQRIIATFEANKAKHLKLLESPHCIRFLDYVSVRGTSLGHPFVAVVPPDIIPEKQRSGTHFGRDLAILKYGEASSSAIEEHKYWGEQNLVGDEIVVEFRRTSNV